MANILVVDDELGIRDLLSDILNDEGQMAGSAILADFPSREALDQEWLQREPYVTGHVWQTVTVHRAQVPAFLLER